jgi:hypothetical protein
MITLWMALQRSAHLSWACADRRPVARLRQDLPEGTALIGLEAPHGRLRASSSR